MKCSTTTPPLLLLLLTLLLSRSDAFFTPSLLHKQWSLSPASRPSNVAPPSARLCSAIRHSDDDDVYDNSKPFFGTVWKQNHPLASLMLGVALVWLPAAPAALAVSGGGLDYAGLDISGQDFSQANYKGKDFTQVLAKATNFKGSKLQGCRFYKAYLVKADFTDADLTGAALEDTSMDEASLKNAVAIGSYFSASILDTATVENADFTDASFPTKALTSLCERTDARGTNPVTGVDTRESLMCP